MPKALISPVTKFVGLILFVGAIAGVIVFTIGFEYLPFLVFSSILFLFSLLIMQGAVGVLNLRNLTIPGFWYFTYLITIFIPAFFVFSGMTPPSYPIAASREHLNNYFFAVQSVLLTVPLGIVFVNVVSRFKKEEIGRFFSASIQEKHADIRYVTCLILVTLAVGLTLLFFYEVKDIPLLYMLSRTADWGELDELRIEVFGLESSFSYVYIMLRTLVYPVLISMTLGFFLYTRQLKWLVLFLLSLIIGVLYLLSTTGREPVVSTIAVAVLFFYLYRKGKITVKFFVVSLVLVSLFPFLFYSITGEMDFKEFLAYVWHREFLMPAYILSLYFDLVPDVVGYLHGRTIEKLAFFYELFGGQGYFFIENYANRYYTTNPDWGVMPGAFLGNLHADFGLFGILFGGFFTGVLMQSLQVYIIRKEKSISTLVIYAFLIVAFWKINHTALHRVILSYGVFFVMVLFWMIRIGENVIRRAAERSKGIEKFSVTENTL